MYLDFNFLMNPDSVRENIKKILKEKKISIAKAEKTAGIGSTVLRCFLMGKTQYTKLENLIMLAKVLEVDLVDLIETPDKEVEAKQNLPWKSGIFSKASDILDDFLSVQTYTLKNYEVFPVLLEVYYLYSITEPTREFDEGMIKLFFAKAFERKDLKKD